MMGGGIAKDKKFIKNYGSDSRGCDVLHIVMTSWNPNLYI